MERSIMRIYEWGVIVNHYSITYLLLPVGEETMSRDGYRSSQIGQHVP